MDSYLLRVEAINLDSFIGDTDDLSTIRGAGLLLLNTPRFLCGGSDVGDGKPASEQKETNTFFKLSNALSTQMDFPNLYEWRDLKFSLVSQGASICIFCFSGTAENAASVRRALDDWLAKHPKLRYATFAVEVTQMENGGFRNARDRLLSRIRLRQMRQLSLSPPAVEPSATKFCDIDGKRPAVVDLLQLTALDPSSAYAKASDKNDVSHATEVRRSYGRNAKVRLFGLLGRELDPAKPFIPTWTFEEISKRGKSRLDAIGRPDPLAHLEGKIAVLYFDGNSFGQLQRDAVESVEQQRRFDLDIERFRKDLIDGLVDLVQEDPKWQVTPTAEARAFFRSELAASGHSVVSKLEFQARIETLMWGGDELIWVVPAWCGLDALEYFYDRSAGLASHGKQLTHAAGIVFCSHKSPVREVVKLAKTLAESVKDQLVRHAQNYEDVPKDDVPHRSYSNAFAYQVLESFDDLGTEFSESRKLRRLPGVEVVDELICAESLPAIQSCIAKFKVQGLAKNRLFEILQQLRGRPSTDLANLYARIAATSPVEKDDLEAHVCPAGQRMTLGKTMFSSPASKWQHLVEIWDYAGFQ